MDPNQGILWTPQHCNRQRYQLAKSLVNSPHKELAGLFRRKLSEYAFQGTLYGLLMSGCFVALSWTRYRVMKVHKPGALVALLCGGSLGWAVGTSIGTEKALKDIGRIAEDPALDEKRTEILEQCRAKVQ
jgi:hypothetical protein